MTSSHFVSALVRLGEFGMDIIAINRRHVFTCEEAQEVIPVVFRITKNYCLKVEALIDRIDSLGLTSDDLVNRLEGEVNDLIHDWQLKVQKLGALPKGLWIADFDAGDGYFCWKYPERRIEFWHQYADGYSKRRRVIERSGLALAPAPRPAPTAMPTSPRLIQRIFSLSSSDHAPTLSTVRSSLKSPRSSIEDRNPDPKQTP